MDSSYQHQPQTMGPYYFYNSDPKLENQTHAYYTELAESNQNSMYHQRWPQPSMPLNSSFSRPRSSASSIPIPISQGYQSNFPKISHTNSTSTLYQKPHFVNQDQTPRLMVDSNIQEPDLYCFPSTPPLSATASVIGSPFLYQGLPTPLNAPLFCLDQGKDNKIVNESHPHPEWVGCGSPPVTPVFLHPNSLITNTSEALPTHYQFLSPSPSPYSVPTLTQQQNFDYCDPRNLTVLPVGQINQPLLKTASPQAFASSTVIAHEGEEKKNIVRSDLQSHENFARNAGPPLSETLGQSIYEQHPEFRTEEFVNGLTGFSSENVRYYPSKRRRSNSTLNSDSSNGETLVSAVEFKNLNYSESLTSACPPSPPLSIHESKLQSQQASRKGRKIRSPKDQPILNTQIQTQILTSSMSGGKEKSHSKDNDQAETSQLQNMSPGIENTNPVESDTTPAPTTRRGRKQSLTHDPTKIFGCAGCSRKFRRQEHMKRHFRSLHTSERPFLCPDCGKRFSRSDNLTQHSRTHGSGSVVMKVRKPREMSIDGNGGSDNKVPIQILGNELYTTAAAISGSESDLTSLPNSSQPASSDHEVHTQKKRKSSS